MAASWQISVFAFEKVTKWQWVTGCVDDINPNWIALVLDAIKLQAELYDRLAKADDPPMP